MRQINFADIRKSNREILLDKDEETGEISGYSWWTPKQDSLCVLFCRDASIHGLKFLGQKKRHLSERIFWLLSILVSILLAAYIIHEIYEEFGRMPVMVTFQPSEVHLDSIPFPAVTICNMNKFPKSKVQELLKIATDPLHANRAKAKKQLVFVRKACDAQQSFAKDFEFAYNRGTNKVGRVQNANKLTEEDLQNMTDFVFENTLPCDQLIRLCKLGDIEQECSKIFRPVLNDFGKCCTFNILPLPLLLRNPSTENKKDATIYDNPILGSSVRLNWPLDELNEWAKWNYEEGFVLTKGTKLPWRQKRPGLPHGLSFLIDPHTEDYYCPSSDAMGASYILHSPLEMPPVVDFSSVAHLDKEILIEVHPDVTNADDDIREIEPFKRMCFFGKERHLRFFNPYTGGNCLDECAAKLITESCDCALFYMPKEDGVRICNSDRTSDDFECIEETKMELQEKMRYECKQCLTLCKNIAYNYETTIADLQPWENLWGDPNPEMYGNRPPKWANHTMSLVHVFFGAEKTVPKLRKRISKTTDLIANIGGILGLCLGFSILSCVEVFYFCTIRSFWKFWTRRGLKKQQQVRHSGNNSSGMIKRLFQKQHSNKVIQLNPNLIPVYPYDIDVKHHSRIAAFYGW